VRHRIGMRLFIAAVLLGGTASAERAPRPVLVTVDDLPIAAPGLHADPTERERITHGLLQALALHHIQAVGFVTWGNLRAEGETSLLEEWIRAGHELGNHSWSHPDYTSVAPEEYVADDERARAKLAACLEPHGK